MTAGGDPSGPGGVRVVELRCQVPDTVLALGNEPARLWWRVVATDLRARQIAFEVQSSSTDAFAEILATSGVVESAEQVAIPAPGGPMHSREVRYHRVRIATEAGWTDWGPTLGVEAGLLDAADWVAEAITLPDDPGADRQSPSPILRRSFDLPAAVTGGRLYVTALGVHHVTINGRPVSDDLLAPGWTTYRRRLLADTYDVGSLLAPGENVVAGVLGDGWYRGRLGWDRDGDRGRYGSQLGLIAQLEVHLDDGTTRTIATDASWAASTAEIRSADLYDGSVIDLRQAKPGWDRVGFDASGWASAAVVPYDREVIQPRTAPPVRVAEVLPIAPEAATGSVSLDAGQNVAGFVRLRVRGRAGATVTVRHAEVLEADGSLHTKSLRSAKATDTYTLADDRETVLEPSFTFHGFRYAEIDTDAQVLGAEVVSISSATPRRSRFESASTLLDRLHENVVWSQRDNFVSVPTDCPQRDERLGWTGDAQAFAATASTLFDTEAFWASWLRDLALDQDDELGVPSVVPDMVLGGAPRFGRAGWGDAATIVPWAVFEAYGDRQVLLDQFDSMRRWIESLRARLGPDGLLGESMQFGDWLDPDAPPGRPWEAKVDSTYLANAFLVHSARLAAEAAAVIGDPAREAGYRTLADRIATATWARWADHAGASQTGCAVALQFRVVPDIGRTALGDALARLVRDANGRVATGFLGTPLVLPALADTGHIDEAYLMLLRREVPSWLYQVIQGATTVWERWDAIRPDGSIHPGTMTTPPDVPESGDDGAHMLSFNHYAYGAVVDWVYRHVAGIAPIRDEPGYRRIEFAPKPALGIDWARASIETRYGNASIDWRLDGAGDLRVDVELPFGTSGRFSAPVTGASRVLVDGQDADASIALEPGRHSLVVTSPRIAAGWAASTAPAAEFATD